MRFVLPSVAVLMLSLAAAACPAATIVWTPALNIGGDADVLTAGAPVASASFGPSGTSDATVNGVTFVGFVVPNNSNNLTVGNVNLIETQGPLASFNLSSNAAPFFNLSSGYKNLLTGVASSGVTESLQVTVSGLTVGQLYAVQAFANFSSASAAGAGSTIVGGPTLDLNTTDSNGGLGQYANGTFVADATTQAFLVNGAGDFAGLGALPFLNGFQLRAVPEPTTLAALAAAATFGLGRRRRA